MIASDIPETFRTSHAMAQALASYIDCPHKVRRLVLENFHSAPDAQTIRKMREKHLAPKVDLIGPAKPYDGYYPQDAANSLSATNSLFLLRLEQERTLSLAMRDYHKRVPEVVE